jgi:hypothetical protein
MEQENDSLCFYCTFYMDQMHKLACDHYICNNCCNDIIDFKYHHNECPRNWLGPKKRSISLPIVPIKRCDQFKLIMKKQSASIPKIVNPSN